MRVLSRAIRNLPVPVVLACLLSLLAAMSAAASDDNSLADLGITTAGAVVSPEFRYDTWEYNVTVPEGTTELALSPRTTNPNASVNGVSGTALDADGNGTVVITVTSESGNAFEYVLHVTQERGAVDPAAAIAANETGGATIDTEVVQSEVETEDPRFVKVDRNSLQEAEKTIERLQDEIVFLKNRTHLFTYVIYGLIAVSVIFLFLVISLLLRKKDLSTELNEYKKSEYAARSGAGRAEVSGDGWGDWDDEEVVPKKKKSKKNRKGQEERLTPVNAQTSWTDAQVGTPVQPQRPAQTGSLPQGPAAQAAAARKKSGQTKASQQRSAQRVSDNTRLYSASQQPLHSEDVPRDVTKDLTRVRRAEAKAMKKAAAAEEKAREQERRAAASRAAEAKRQAQEERRIAEETERARAAQEEAIGRAQEERRASGASQSASPAGDGKSVRVDLIDL